MGCSCFVREVIQYGHSSWLISTCLLKKGILLSWILITPRYRTDNLLPLGITPGPKSPQDLDSFIAPFLEELELLQKGVAAYDAFTKSPFVLKAHLILVTGDTPAISKLLHLSGHTAKYPCRACTLEGTLSRYTITNEKDNTTTNHAMHYFPPHAIVSLRTFESYRRNGQQCINNGRSKKKINVMGVTGISPLAILKYISIPDCSPFDVMHLVFLCFTRDLCKLLNGTYFARRRSDLSGVQMDPKVWEAFGRDMAKIQAPVSWGRYQTGVM